MSYQDYIDSQNQQLLDDVAGRGGGDPDRWGYPYEHEPTCYLNVHGGHGSKCDCKYSKGEPLEAPKGDSSENHSN